MLSMTAAIPALTTPRSASTRNPKSPPSLASTKKQRTSTTKAHSPATSAPTTPSRLSSTPSRQMNLPEWHWWREAPACSSIRKCLHVISARPAQTLSPPPTSQAAWLWQTCPQPDSGFWKPPPPPVPITSRTSLPLTTGWHSQGTRS